MSVIHLKAVLYAVIIEDMALYSAPPDTLECEVLAEQCIGEPAVVFLV
jgi:hypothetical protein